MNASADGTTRRFGFVMKEHPDAGPDNILRILRELEDSPSNA